MTYLIITNINKYYAIYNYILFIMIIYHFRCVVDNSVYNYDLEALNIYH